MVEENEIRVGLSYYERARVAARAAEAGVFADAHAAIARLFSSASKAKRSKILSFVAVYEALDNELAYPAAIPERLGLKLAKAIEAGQGAAIRSGLMQAAADSVEAEQAALARAVAGGAKRAMDPGRSAPEVVPGVRLARTRAGIVLSGPGADSALLDAVEVWLKSKWG